MDAKDMQMMEERISHWESHGEVLKGNKTGGNELDDRYATEMWIDHSYGTEIWEDLE